jgi:hypothetical protein
VTIALKANECPLPADIASRSELQKHDGGTVKVKG